MDIELEKLFDNKEVCSEVLAVILALGDKYIKALPWGFVEKLSKSSSIDLLPNLDMDKRIEEQENISHEARVFLAGISKVYWENKV